MKICIIVHSKTGTTLKFGEIIARKLQEKGHTVDLVRLETAGPVRPGSVRQAQKITITNMPDGAKYDVICAGGPVWGFSASPVIIECLKGLKNISGKKIVPFATMGFPFQGMGGSQAINLMSSVAENAGAAMLPGKVVTKMFHNSKKLMENAATEIADDLAVGK